MTTNRSVLIGGWTWTSGLGVLFGASPTGERVTVAQPLMSSPWWTIGDPETIGATDPIVEGQVFPLFKNPRAAIDHTIATHRPPLPTEPEIAYEVWERDCLTGEETRWGGNPGGGYATPKSAQFQCDKFNEDQKWHDRFEDIKPTRKFFVAETTTTRRRYEPAMG